MQNESLSGVPDPPEALIQSAHATGGEGVDARREPGHDGGGGRPCGVAVG
ncbi:MAG: hypothetical protein RLO21_15455 [Nitratireductor sp.]